MKLSNLNAAVAFENYPELSRTGTNYMWVRMMAQVNLARSPLFRDQGNFAIQFSLEICTANFISNSRNLEVGIFLSSVTWSSFLQLTYKVRCALVRFWNRSYAFRPNLTPLSSVTIIYQEQHQIHHSRWKTLSIWNSRGSNYDLYNSTGATTVLYKKLFTIHQVQGILSEK